MRYTAQAALMGGSLWVLAACGGAQESAEAPASVEATDETVGQTDGEMAATAETVDLTDLRTVAAGEWRTEAAQRDEWRHPVETLEFFGVDPSSRVVEIWPGAGWYTTVLAPWIAANGGQYVAAYFPADASGNARDRARQRFEDRFADSALYGEIEMADFDRNVGLGLEPASVDSILTFRNIHNWMSRNYAEYAFSEFYTALRPGGLLGVVEHRLPSTREQDPGASTGYVQEAYVIALAEEAGFELVRRSEINANPADHADHPFGVWTLPPVRRSPGEGEEGYGDFDREAYDAIGESDRMTLLFRKPDAAEAPAADAAEPDDTAQDDGE